MPCPNVFQIRDWSFWEGIKMATPIRSRKGVILMVGLVCFSISADFAFGETKIFVEEYTYQASEADSNFSSRVIALEKVKRLLLDKLGTYLESETEVRNFHLTKDQIVILTAGIVSAEIIDEKWDGKTYYLKAKITADPKDVAKAINKLRQDRQKTRELEETRKRADEALGEVEKLKKELAIARAEKLNLREYNEAINRLSATDWVDKGYALVTFGKNQEAVEAFTRAIELDPKNGKIYYNRGGVYGRLEDYRRAIRDFDRAIELNPQLAEAYTDRGVAYEMLGDHRQAVRDYDKAVELKPKDERAYVNRGIAYAKLGSHRQAIRDYDKAIELNPKDERAYLNRGFAYAKLGDHRQAIEDYKTAARFGSRTAQHYLSSKGISW
jgi:tetratricopeptide (TPR) repeat protein